MLINTTLTEIIEVTVLLSMMLALYNVFIATSCKKRFYLQDKAGHVSLTVFSDFDLHLPEMTKIRIVRIGLEVFVAGMAAIMVTSLMAGVIRQSPVISEMGHFTSGLFIWFGLMQINRALSSYYILQQLTRVRAKSVKIDRVKHYIVTVPKLEWLLRERFYSSTILMIAVAVFFAIFC